MRQNNSCQQKGYKLWIIGVMLLCLFCLSGISQAKQEEEVVSVKLKQVQGEISAITKDFIAVVYKQDKKNDREYEMALPIGKDVRLVHKKRLDEIKEGDIVAIQYEEKITRYKDYKGEEKEHSQRRAKLIKFLKPAEARPELIRE